MVIFLKPEFLTKLLYGDLCCRMLRHFPKVLKFEVVTCLICFVNSSRAVCPFQTLKVQTSLSISNTKTSDCCTGPQLYSSTPLHSCYALEKNDSTCRLGSSSHQPSWLGEKYQPPITCNYYCCQVWVVAVGQPVMNLVTSTILTHLGWPNAACPQL